MNDEMLGRIKIDVKTAEIVRMVSDNDAMGDILVDDAGQSPWTVRPRSSPMFEVLGKSSILWGMGVTIRNRPFAKPVSVRHSLELFVALAFGFSAAGNASADSFNIGPVKLGMTNRQVSQVVRLENCDSHSSKQITCSARLPSSMGAQSMTLTFDSHSKKLVQAGLSKEGWPLLDNRVAQLFRDLSIADCPVSRRGPGMGEDFTDICLEAPNQVRYIRTESTYYRRPNSRVFRFQSVQIVVDAKLYTEQTTRLIATERSKALYKVQQQKNREFEAGR